MASKAPFLRSKRMLAQAGFAEMKSRRRGFTLTEAALVLGIVGLVLGAIWVAYSSVQGGRSAAKAQGEIQAIVHNLRTLYGAQGGFSNASVHDITTAMIAAGVFPTDMVVSPAEARSAWGTQVELWVVAANEFQFRDLGKPDGTEMCARMLALNVGDGRDPTLQFVTDGSGGSATAADTISGATAATFCDGKTGYGLEYNLK